MVHVTLLLSTATASIRKNKKLWFGIAFGILIVFAALRYGFGNDYFSYYRLFNKAKAGDDAFAKEPMFSFLVWLCPNFYVFIALTSLMTILPVFFLMKKYVAESYRWIAFLIYCINPYLFLMSLSTIRQMLALSCFIFAVHFSRKRKIIPYLIFIALAVTCHASAIILLPVYFIANDKKVSRIQLMTLLLIMLVLLIDKNAFGRLIQLVLKLLHITKYSDYTVRGGNALRATLLTSVWFLYIAVNLHRLYGRTLTFAKLSLIAYTVDILAYRFSMLTRITMYFEIFSVVSLPMILYQNNTVFKNETGKFAFVNKYVFPALILTIYVLRYYSFFANPMWESFRVYHTVFSVI